MALSSIEATFQIVATAKAVVSSALLPGADANERNIQFKEANLATTTLGSSSTPAVAAIVPLKLTMVTSTPYSLDLTAAPQPGGESAIDLSGEKLIGIALYAPSTNTNPITVEPNATDGYDLWMDGGGVQVPKAGNMAFLDQVAARDDVDGSNKIIDFDGTDGDVIIAILVFGS